MDCYRTKEKQTLTYSSYNLMAKSMVFKVNKDVRIAMLIDDIIAGQHA